MAITLADFNKIWASTSPLTPYSFSEANYKQGWNFVGSTPPARQMWDFLQKNNDKKMQYLANNYLPLTGGTMTGDIVFSKTDFAIRASTDTNSNNFWGGTNWSKGSYLTLYGVDHASYPGWFRLYARDKVNNVSIELRGKPDATLTWGGNNILTAGNYNSYALPLSGGTMTGSITMPVDSNYSAVKNVGTNGRVTIGGGTAYNTGAFIWLYGKDHTQEGAFDIDANNGSTYTRLHGAADGILTWGDNNVITANNLSSVFSLSDTYATEITSGADLNNYTTAGTYITTGESATASLLNCPTATGAIKLVVLYTGYGNVSWSGRQIIYARDGIYIRMWNNSVATGSWGDWKRFAYAENVLALTGGTLTGPVKSLNTLSFQSSVLEKGTNPSVASYPQWITYYDKNGFTDSNRICGVGGILSTSGEVSYGLLAYKYEANSTSYNSVFLTTPLTGDPSFRPSSDNIVTLGRSSNRWKELYAGTATINTSDERLKDNIEAIPDDVLDAWGEVGWYQYQFKDSIAEKGEKARLHTGAIAQRIESVFKAHNLDAFRYGLLCYDEWDAVEESKDEDGNVVQEAMEAGNRYSLRYEEALCMEASYQRRRADRLEARIEALEKLLKK